MPPPPTFLLNERIPQVHTRFAYSPPIFFPGSARKLFFWQTSGGSRETEPPGNRDSPHCAREIDCLRSFPTPPFSVHLASENAPHCPAKSTRVHLVGTPPSIVKLRRLPRFDRSWFIKTKIAPATWCWWSISLLFLLLLQSSPGWKLAFYVLFYVLLCP